jgi:hypothetical protein
MLLMTRYRPAAAHRLQCGNHADGQSCTMPMLHDGHHGGLLIGAAVADPLLRRQR